MLLKKLLPISKEKPTELTKNMKEDLTNTNPKLIELMVKLTLLTKILPTPPNYYKMFYTYKKLT